MEIDEALEKGLRMIEAEGAANWSSKDGDGKLHVSDLTACRLAVQLRRRNVPITNIKPVEDILVKEAGKGFHELLQLALKKAGVLIRADFKEDPFTIEDGSVRGHPDVLCLLDAGRGLEVWDIKSKKTRYFGKNKVIAPSEEEMTQIHAYMGPLGIKQGGFIFVNRDNGRYYPVRIDWQESIYEEGKQLANRILLDDKSEKLPERLEPDNWRCRYQTADGIEVTCAWFSRCWPEYPTKTVIR